MTILYIALPILIVDQLTKFIILKEFRPGESLPVIKNIFHLSLVLNRGVAFGIFSQAAAGIFVGISIICVSIIIFLFVFGKKDCEQKNFFAAQTKTAQISLSLILAGAVGNLIDRIRFGFVIDFLDLRIWPVFNLADAAITIGTILLVTQILKTKTLNFKH